MEASVAATPGQGAPAQSDVQPSANGQGSQSGGQSTAAGKGSFNWGLFPTVPESQRELLEPHLGNVQSHVTRLEQQYAPYRGLMDTVGADQVQPLIEFLTGWSSNPLETWLGLAQSLQQDGVLGSHVTPDALQALIQGGVAQQPTQSGAQDEMPPWAQQMQQKLDAYEQAEQSRQLAQQEAEQDQMLQVAKSTIREQLTQAGIPEEAIGDELIIGTIIANDGDVTQSITHLTNLRDNLLRAFTQGKTGAPSAPNVNGQLPEMPKPRPARKGDMFAGAKDAALQHLKQSMVASAQE